MADPAPAQPRLRLIFRPRYPTIQEIMDAPTDVNDSTGPPTRFCWKVTNGPYISREPGGWTDFGLAWPICTDIKHIIFVFQRISKNFTKEVKDIRGPEKSFAANALIAIRMHQVLGIGGQVIHGNTLLYCMTINREADFEMPAYLDEIYGPGFYHSSSWYGFIETMERVATLQMPVPPIHLVSRSISSLTCKIDPALNGWAQFQHRPLFATLGQSLRVVYQVPNDWYDRWPAAEKEVAPHIVPFVVDRVLPIKYISIPLLSLLRPRPGLEPAW